mgnify:CR=1 FL=1
MCAVARKIEATLFYQIDPLLAFKQLADDLVTAFDSTPVTLHPRLVTPTELGCIIGGLTLTLLRHPDMVATPPLPHEASTQTRSTAFTLRISGPEGAAQTSTRLALCYVAVMQVLSRARADRIHWSYTNVIHTRDSFLLESSGRHMTPNGVRALPRARTLGPTRQVTATSKGTDASQSTGQINIARIGQTNLCAPKDPASLASNGDHSTPCRMSKTQPIGMSTRIYEKWHSPAPSQVSDRLSQFLAGFRT